jgi:PKD repeat protein
VVTLKANGGVRADVNAGQAVRFSAVVEVPPNTGKVVSAEWDFDGTGAFADVAKFSPGVKVTLNTTHAFAKPGTYFVTLRAASQRDGDVKASFARILNIDRVRVVVK